MFKRIFVPLPMEDIPAKATRRAGEVAKVLGSDVIMTYIIQEEIFDEVEKQSTHVITSGSKHSFSKHMKEVHRKGAKKVIKPAVREVMGFDPDEFYIREGTYDKVIRKTIEEMDIDLVMMEYESFNLIKYQIMDNSPVPIWIVRNEGPVKKIGLFTTNLAPNKRAPKMAKKLAKEFGAKLRSYYIRDDRGKDTEREPEQIEKKFGIKFNDVVDSDFETGLYKMAKNEDLDVIILGRIKKIGYFNMRSKFAKKTHCSVLLIN